ncbi:MAG: nucleotidyltransferase family protein [Peptococcaceae bacterium]|jgi:CTP:molybdopterin cytidylyltransferase MocA|nr:nucleotidyltransferase family protein [Peptococcaceae bacterium]
MNTGAIILAAGMSSRMGDFKPLLKIGPYTAIQRIITTLREAGVSPIVLVTGHQAERLESHVSGLDVVCVRNEEYESSQMLDSIKIGLRYLEKRCGQTLITPADVPLFAEETVRALVTLGADVAMPTYNGRNGHPMLVSVDMFPIIEAFDGERGMAGAIKAAGCPIKKIEVDDEGILLGMNTPDEYQRLLNKYQLIFDGDGRLPAPQYIYTREQKGK